MRHSVFGRQLSRNKNERRRLFQGLARDLILHGLVRTTIAKARAVQPLIEKLVTSAKKSVGGLHTDAPHQQVRKVLADKVTEKLLLADAGTRFAGRQSGFTRIVKLGPRMGDAAEEVMVQFVDERVVVEVVKSKEKPSVKDESQKVSKLVKMKKPDRPKKIKKAKL